MALLSSFGGRESEKYIGWAYGANGIALMFGPVGGAFLYKIGGYTWPYYGFGKYSSSIILLLLI